MEEEARLNEEIDENNYKTQKEGTDWDNNIGISHAADTETYIDKPDDVISDIALEGADVVDDDFFEHVSLKDCVKNAEDVNPSLNPNKLRHSSTESDNVFDFSFAHARSTGIDSPQGAEVRNNIYFSSTGPDIDSDFDMEASPSASVDSAVHLHGDFGYSPVESPQKPKTKHIIPNVSPELLHLVDSAIMGKAESLEKLKIVVSGVESFGGDDEAVAISYLVVDSLLATMGGVESFEEDEDDNPPSVMLNSRAAIVAGGLIPWLPEIGDFQGLMSPRTRMTIFRNPRDVKPYVVPYSERFNLPASAIHASSDSLIIVDTNAPAAHIAQHKWQPNAPDGQGTPFLFHHGRPGGVAGGGAFMPMFKGPTASGLEEFHFPQALAFPTSGIQSSGIVSITCDGEIITGGHVDNSVRLISADGAKTIEIARGHCAPVTCLDLSSDSNYLVTGSRDATVLLWRIHRASSSRSSTSQKPSTNPGTPKSPGVRAAANNLAENSRGHRIQGPIHVLRGHLGEITSCSVSSDIGIVASCSKSSDLLMHSIRRGRLVRRLVGVEAHSVCISSLGIIIAWNRYLCTLRTFTPNGSLIAKKQLPLLSSVSCIEVSVDGRSALVGINPSLENDGDTDYSQLMK